MSVKPEVVQVGSQQVRRIWVRTGLLTEKDNLVAVMRRFVVPIVQPGDIVTIAESPVAIMQGRAIPVTKIKPGFWASVLWRFVKKVPYGIGLRSPWSMQCAIDEVGAPRIVRAALAGAWGKLRGRSGDFYRVAGKQAAMIDAAHTSGVKEYYEYVIKGPLDPDAVARQMKEITGCESAVVDANDIFGCTVVGASDRLDTELVQQAMRDNPAGQGDAMTPVILLRPAGKRQNDSAGSRDE
ncbi:MAG: coenzyme F420-0:L-glutamate ligase [candidate division WOR-3 bacterium]